MGDNYKLKGWRYEFDAWIEILGSEPIELIKSIDKSESYEQDHKHLFKLDNGEYAVIHESGDSCYEPSDAIINKFPDLDSAITFFRKTESYEKPNKWSDED